MTELPYTDADLRAEAVSVHADLVEDPDFTSVGEAMCDRVVPSTSPGPDNPATGHTWAELLPYQADGGEAYNAAQRKIHDLIGGAADLSEWAVNLGADGLEPTGYVLKVGSATKQVARIHFAFDPDLSQDARISLVEGLAEVIANSL